MTDAMRRPFEAASAEMLLGWGGQAGVDIIDDTTPTNGPWCKIVAKGAVVIDSLTSNWSDKPATMIDGEAIYGVFEAITLTSGTVYCYRKLVGE